MLIYVKFGNAAKETYKMLKVYLEIKISAILKHLRGLLGLKWLSFCTR
jgi:hypothetical protein